MTTGLKVNKLDASFISKAFDFGRDDVKAAPPPDVYAPETTKTGDEDPNSTADLLKDWASETSAHGCAHAASKSRGFISRLAWTLAVTIMLGSLIYTLYTMLKAYDQYPVNTITKVSVKPALPFPGLTICNINDVDLDIVPLDRDLFSSYKVHTAWQFDFDYSASGAHDMINTPIDRVVNSSWIDNEHFFLGCKLNGQENLDCGELFTSFQTSKSKCAVLNTSLPFLQSMSFAGPMSGIQMYINVHQDGYVLNEFASAGIKLFVHEPGRMANLHSSGIVLSPGVSSYVSLRPTKYTFLPAPYKAYGDEACVELDKPANHRKLRLTDMYTFEACVLECAVTIVADICGCNGVLNDLENSSLPLCTVLQFYQCYEKKLTPVYFNVSAENYCECPRPCVFTTYKTQISTAVFPSAVTSALLKMLRILPASNISYGHNYLDVRIFLEQIVQEEVVHEAVYTLTSILGTVGGQMGVFLGASMLTIAELLELIFFAAFQVLRRLSGPKHRVGQAKTIRVQPTTPSNVS